MSPSPQKRSFPLALKLEGKKCLVVGSDRAALERALNLTESGARVVLVASSPSDALRELSQTHGIPLEERAYVPSDLEHAWLAVLTDPDPELAAKLARDAGQRRVFFCAVDRPSLSTYAHVAIARAGIVTLSIATEGKAPALGRKLREELQRLMDEASLSEFAQALSELRERTPSADRKAVLGEAVQKLHLEGRLRVDDPDSEN